MSSISGSTLSLTGVATINGLSVASGATTLGTVQTGNFSQTGSSTFSTGSGLISLNGTVNTSGTLSVGTNLGVSGTTTINNLLTANSGVKIPVNTSIYLSTDSSNYITNNSTGSGSISYATFDSGKTHDFYCYNGSKIYTISSSGTITNGTGTFSGLLTANSGIANTGLIKNIGSGGSVTSNGQVFPNVALTTNTGYRLQIPVGSWNKDTNNNTTILDCYRVGNNGGIYDNYVGINASSSPAGNGFCINSQMDFVIGATSAQYLVKGMSIQAQSSSAVNVGINNTNPQYALDVSGTGNFTGALTANAGVKIPTGLQLFLSTDGNNYITNNSTNAKIQYVTFDAGKSHDFWVVDGSKFNISQTGTNTYGTASVSSLFYVGGTSSSSTYMRLEANINNNNGYIDLKNGGSFCFRQNLGTSAIDAPIVCGAITSSGAITANGGITVPSGQTLTIASGASFSYGGGLTLGGNITLASTFTTPTSGQLGYTISGSNNSTQALVSNTTRTFATIFLPVGVWMITAMPAYICTTATSTAGIYQFGISTTTDSPSSICGYHNGISSVDASMFSFTQSINISTNSTMIYLRGRVYFPAGAGTVTVHSSTSINAIRIA